MRDQLLYTFLGVGRGVKRLDGRLMFSGADFRDEHRILLLDVRGIKSMMPHKVAGGGRAMDRTVIIFAEARQLAGVIQMRMAQDHCVHRRVSNGKNFIELFRFLAMALEQTAFEQQVFAVDLNEIHGAGRGARGAEEVDFHPGKMPTRSGKSSVPVGILRQNTVDIRCESAKFSLHL